VTGRRSPIVRQARAWRDAVLTAAAFSLILASVIGVGPFGSGVSTIAADASASRHAVGDKGIAARFAGLND
jgi:hypothetical protein